jgi:hypothetical protein
MSHVLAMIRLLGHAEKVELANTDECMLRAESHVREGGEVRRDRRRHTERRQRRAALASASVHTMREDTRRGRQ